MIGRSQRLCFTAVMTRLKKLLSGGSDGNEQLTAIVGTLLLVLLAIESATLLNLRSLLTMHAFVGMLLIPIVALKLASTSWRMLRYYRRGEEYVRRGPPHVVLRLLIAPVLVVSTLALFGTGVVLLVLGQTDGTVVGLHQASFVVWVGAIGVHVLPYALRLPRLIRQRFPGTGLRIALVVAALLAGALLAIATLPAADRLQDRASGRIGVDAD